MKKTKLKKNEIIPTELLKKSEREVIPDSNKVILQFRFIYIVFKLSQLIIGDKLLRLNGKRSLECRNDRIIGILENLNMIWIKAAQAIIMSRGVLSRDLGMQLMNLSDRGGKNSFSIIKQVVESELGSSIDEIFDHFEETPFIATHLAQVHYAKLKKEKVWATVKVHQPGAEKLFLKDLKILSKLVKILNFFSIHTNMKWEELHSELTDIKDKELNYYYEATALEKLEENGVDQDVYVPEVFRDYCRKGILVLEDLKGVALSDISYMKKNNPERLELWIKQNNVDLKKVALSLYNSTYRQIFEDNFFDSNMNTHNLVLLKDSNIALLGCESADSLEKESLEKQKMYLKSLARGEYVTATEIYFLLVSRLPKIDLYSVKENIVKVMRILEKRGYLEKLPYIEKSLGYMIGKINEIGFHSNFTPLWSSVKLNWALIHLDNSISLLYPELNYLKELRSYFKHSERRESIEQIFNMPSRITDSLSAVQELPIRNAEFKIFSEAIMRKQGQVVQGSSSKFDTVLAASFGFLSHVVLLVIFLLVLEFYEFYFGSRSFETFLGDQLVFLSSYIPRMNILLWVCVFLILGGLFISLRKNRNRFHRTEYGQD